MLASVSSSLIRFLSRTGLAFGAATLLVGSGSVLGCGTQCDRNPDEPPIAWKGGIRNPATGWYFSAAASGPYLPFPPGRTYRFYHGLGGRPETFQAFLSFAEDPLPDAKPDGFTLASGNQVTFEAVNASYIDVRNDTCSDVRIRLAAFFPGFASLLQADGASAPSSSTDAGR